MAKQKTSIEKIEEQSVIEFLDKGFEKASLRQIVKNAGVTTGAFYKYYNSKEEIFYRLVDPIVKEFTELYDRYCEKLMNMEKPYSTQEMVRITSEGVSELMDYMYQNKPVFNILINKASATKYENFTMLCVKRQIDATMKFVEKNASHELFMKIADQFVCEMIIKGRTITMFDIILNTEKKEEAQDKIKRLEDYFTAGFEHYWKSMIENKAK